MKPYCGEAAEPTRRLKAAARLIAFWPLSPGVTYTLGELLFQLLGMRRKGEEFALSEAKRVLVVRLDEIGDVLMSTPFLRELRRLLPIAWITLIVKPAVYNLVERCPYVHEVLTFDWRGSRYPESLPQRWRALVLAYRYLWPRRFDMAILPRWDTDSYRATIITYLSGARWRLGYSENVTEEKQCLNAGYDRLFTHVLDDKTVKHEVERSLDILRFMGGTVQDDRLELWLSEEDEVFAEKTLKSHHVNPDDSLIAIGPGARAPKRMWRIESFIKLGDWLVREFQGRILVMGERGEEALGQELQWNLGEKVINVVGQTSLRQVGALLRRCQLFVGNDTGLAHLAAAAGVPVVEISCHPQDGSASHYNSPTRFAPWGVPHWVLQPETGLDHCSGECTAARAHCIASIDVEQVKGAVVATLSQRNRTPIRKM